MPVGVTVPASSASPAPLARLAALPGVSTASGVAAAARHAQVTGKVLPVLPELAGLLPAGGLRRGGTVAVHGSPSLLLALLAEATSRGSWAAVVGVPELGVVAAHELGVAVDRLALVNRPGMEFGAVTAALLDGMDLVAVGGAGGGARGAGPSRSQQLARRLSARARNRGAVLLSLGPWPGAEVELNCEAIAWHGLLGSGKGFLRGAELNVRTSGRGAAARPLHASVTLPRRDTPARPETTEPPMHAVPGWLSTEEAPEHRAVRGAPEQASPEHWSRREAPGRLTAGEMPDRAVPGHRNDAAPERGVEPAASGRWAPEPAASEQRGDAVPGRWVSEPAARERWGDAVPERGGEPVASGRWAPEPAAREQRGDAVPERWSEPAASERWAPGPAASEQWGDAVPGRWAPEPAAPERWSNTASERWASEPAAPEQWGEAERWGEHSPVEAGVG